MLLILITHAAVVAVKVQLLSASTACIVAIVLADGTTGGGLLHQLTEGIVLVVPLAFVGLN